MSRKILIVDDSEVVTKLVQYHFTDEGYTVLVASDGLTGLKVASQEKPDVILLDVQMPGLDGYEVCRKLRESQDTDRIPIAMLTSMSSIANMQTGFEAGADEYITKPFQVSELQVRVEALLRRAARIADPQLPAGEIIAVFSLRGGAGCSSLAVNLAVGLSRLWTTESVLVDLALPTGHCDMMLNLKPTHNMGTVAQRDIADVDEDLISGIMVQHNSGTKLLAGVIDPPEAERVTENLVALVLERLRTMTPYVVVDTSHNFSAPILAVLDRADRILMPITPDINSARLVLSTLKVFRVLGYPEEKVDIVINWTFPKSGISTARLEEHFDHKILMVIPHIPTVWSKAINAGVPAITGEPDSRSVALLEDLVWHCSADRDRRKGQRYPSKVWTRTVERIRKRAKSSK